jgi:ribose transport system permease protein
VLSIFVGFVVVIVLLQLMTTILSVIQMPEAGRQVIYGIVIIAMLLLYGRERAEQ